MLESMGGRPRKGEEGEAVYVPLPPVRTSIDQLLEEAGAGLERGPGGRSAFLSCSSYWRSDQ